MSSQHTHEHIRSARHTGLTLIGKISWFGGPNDHTDSGHTALGLTTATPGIAVYNHATLGGWWLVNLNGHSQIIQQTDIGPAPSTGRKIDFTYSALPQFGYNEHNFPTDSTATATYLGRDQTAATQKAAGISPTTTTTPTPSTSTPTVVVSGGNPLLTQDAAHPHRAKSLLIYAAVLATAVGLIWLGLRRTSGLKGQPQ